MKPADRERIQVEVCQRVVEHYVQLAKRKPDGYLETVINDTLYHERTRLERSNGGTGDPKAEAAYYRQLQREAIDASPRQQRELLSSLAHHFAREIVGNFDERVYRLATTIIPTGLYALLHAGSPKRVLSLDAFRQNVTDYIVVQGEVAHVQALQHKGTLIVVPTHSSNLDSIILGYAAHWMGLPPLLYGAGLNLFTNPLISYFMNNLGAYRVDRKKQSTFYKDVLKEYATCSLEMGYHNLFFPGGTRCRSGAIEQHLKKGLLGAGLRAYINNLKRNRPNPKIFIAPCTLSYKLVLEGETLIDDYLKEVGKSRYIIEDDEFSKPKKVYNFLANVISLDDRIAVTMCPPLDPFGNRVDREGNSLDPHGRVIETSSYVKRQGEIVEDEQRDAEYTCELSDEIGRSYLKDNVLMSTHLVAYALFRLLKRHNPEMDLYRLLHTGGSAASFAMSDVHRETKYVLDTVKALPNAPRFGEEVIAEDIQDIVADALKHFAIYHTKLAAYRRGDRVYHDDRKLLLYYGNRLRGYGFEEWNTFR